MLKFSNDWNTEKLIFGRQNQQCANEVCVCACAGMVTANLITFQFRILCFVRVISVIVFILHARLPLNHFQSQNVSIGCRVGKLNGKSTRYYEEAPRISREGLVGDLQWLLFFKALSFATISFLTLTGGIPWMSTRPKKNGCSRVEHEIN